MVDWSSARLVLFVCLNRHGDDGRVPLQVPRIEWQGVFRLCHSRRHGGSDPVARRAGADQLKRRI